MTQLFETPEQAIHYWAASTPDITCLMAPGAVDVSFNQLEKQLQRTSQQLADLGYGAESRLALVLPQGILLASALLSHTASCPVMPVNAAWSAPEQAAIFKKAVVRALVTLPGFADSARTAARELGLPVIEVIPSGSIPTGFFSLSGSPAAVQDNTQMQPESLTLIMSTSGTTGSVKLVPVSGRQVATSAGYSAEVMAAGPLDRTIVFGSLNHLAVFTFCLLATVVSGGTSVIAPFDPLQVISQVEHYRPTWLFTSPPMLHQIYEYLHAHPIPPAFKAMRFMRVSTAPFPTEKIITLEQWLGIPVLQTYGMTEGIANNICNPLPSRVRKPETVGLPVHLDVAVFDEEGRQLPAGEVGELAMRSDNIFTGYLNPEDNIPSPFMDGWFMTGDLATIDSEGYVTIVGRRKEMINSGGMKILPREVEEACMSHPEVAEASVVPLPHPTLGEQVAAAVIKRSGTLTEQALYRHLKNHLAPYKIPGVIGFVESIPKTPTGKVNRQLVIERLLAKINAVSSETVESGSAGELAAAILGLWREVLGNNDIKLTDQFIPSGGDSLTAVRLADMLSIKFEIDFSVLDIFDFPSPSSQAAEVNKRLNGLT